MKKFVLTTVAFGLVTCFAAEAFALPRIFPGRRNVYWGPAPAATATVQTDTAFRTDAYEPVPVLRAEPVRTTGRVVARTARAPVAFVLGR